MIEKVILVDNQDNQIGVAEKLQAHQEGLLHRAFSIFLYRYIDNELEILLQQRNMNKYHSGGLWSNTCCGHPRPDEDTHEAAVRRLAEEMNIKTPLQEIAAFQYTKKVNNELVENEFDHLFVGEFKSEQIDPNPDEVQDWQWMSLSELKQKLEQEPEKFTAWFNDALRIFENKEVN